MTTMTSLGIGSGLDLESMLSQLQKAEQTRLVPYTSLQQSYKAKISSWGQISSSLSTLQDTVKKLSGDAFNTLTASSNTAFTATATSDATSDSHEIAVTQLATAHKIKTGIEADADQDLGTADGKRTITITQSDGKEIEVDLDSDQTSLNDIAKAINKKGGDVQASVQHTDEGYQLVLSSKTTGTDGEMSVSVEGDDKLADILSYTPGDDISSKMTTVTQARDAKLTVDGSEYTRSSNKISDIITGVTLDLKAVSETDDKGDPKAEQLTLTQDTSAIKSTIKDFVKQYNALQSQISAARNYVPNDTSGLKNDDVATQNSQSGALVGDSMLRDMGSDLSATVWGVYGDTGADYSSLGELGIDIDRKTGLLTLDEGKLDDAIADDPKQVANIFTEHAGKDGIATSLDSIITKYIGDDEKHIDGQIKTATDTLDSQVTLVQAQIDKMQQLVDASMERYRVQFQNLDATMSKLNGMSSSVTALLSQ